MNSKRGSISFTVEGVSYSARLTTNAMVKYQDDTGETILESFASLQKGRPDIRRFRDIFWAMLVGDFTKEAVGDLMDELGAEEVARIVGEAATAAFPKASDDAAMGNDLAGKKKARKAKTTSRA